MGFADRGKEFKSFCDSTVVVCEAVNVSTEWTDAVWDIGLAFCNWRLLNVLLVSSDLTVFPDWPCKVSNIDPMAGSSVDSPVWTAVCWKVPGSSERAACCI